MKLENVARAPQWLKRDPSNGMFYVKLYRQGRSPDRIERSTGERVSKERAMFLGERIVNQWLGEEAPPPSTEVSFSQVCDELLEDMRSRTKLPGRHRIKHSTLDHAERYLGKFLREEFGPNSITKLAEFHWQSFANEKLKEKPGRNLYPFWKHMNLVMKFAVKRKYRVGDWKIPNPDPEPPEGRRLTEAEKDALVKAAKGRSKVQVVMALTMGLRLREILRQSFDPKDCCHVDLEAGTLTVCRAHAKTRNSARTIMLSPQAHAMLTVCFEKRRTKSLYVFPSRTKRLGQPKRLPWADQNRGAWKSIKTNAGIVGKLKFHHLRHTFLSDCAKRVRGGKAGIAEVCRYAGLSIAVFESVYLHMGAEDTQAVSKFIGVKLGESNSYTRGKAPIYMTE